MMLFDVIEAPDLKYLWWRCGVCGDVFCIPVRAKMFSCPGKRQDNGSHVNCEIWLVFGGHVLSAPHSSSKISLTTGSRPLYYLRGLIWYKVSSGTLNLCSLTHGIIECIMRCGLLRPMILQRGVCLSHAYALNGSRFCSGCRLLRPKKHCVRGESRSLFCE